MKEADGKLVGGCIVCGVIGQGGRDFICEKCGGPDKIMLVCQCCGAKTDLAFLGVGGKIMGFLKKFNYGVNWEGVLEEDIGLGTVIRIPTCWVCYYVGKVINDKPAIYKIRA